MEQSYQIQNVEVSSIKFDENNPRGESEEKILADQQFKQLCESIKEHGVLTPLIIKKDDSGYILIDGERRLRASLYEKRKEAPAIIVDSDISGRILAYQVHMLRKDWNKINEIKSLKVIIEVIKGDNPDINDSDLKKQLKEITNASDTHIDDWIILLKYSDEIIEKVIDEKFPMSHLIRNEKDLLNKIKSKYPKILSKISENEIREVLAQKAERKLLGPTRYLMETFKDVFEKDQKNEEIEALLLLFLENQPIDIKETYQKIINLFTKAVSTPQDEVKQEPNSDAPPPPSNNTDEQKPSPESKKNPKTDKTTLGTSKDSPSIAPFEYKSITVSTKEIRRLNDIKPKFERIGKTFSPEEYEYVSEALLCLEMHCFKAAILMIWSTGISRILAYIDKNLADFNASCASMKGNPKSVFKYYAPHFKSNTTTIEELSMLANDMQLISYLYFKKFINDTQFKKLKANYDSRCDCAHPTLITISANEIITIFENLYTLILTNQKIK